MWMKPRVLLVVLLSFLYLLCSASPISQGQEPAGEKKFQSGGVSSSTAKSAASPAEDSKYVGSDTCKTCHEDLYNSWAKTPHWKTTLDKKAGPSHQGCEGCPGPGAEHVAGGGDKTKIFVFKDHSTKEINDRCMTCHAGGTQHMNAINSIHTKN